jgi:hypothetical protein
MHELLEKTTEATCRYLRQVQPDVSDNWWQDLVLSSLNPNQCYRVHASDGSLHSINLASLLRVFDQN